MDTLHNRLAELADDAPAGGAPAAELWARGKRAHRLRSAALVATLLVVGAVGTGLGVRLADGDGNRSHLEPAKTVRVALPIEYPVGAELPDLGKAPGPLAAIWVAPGVGGGAPEVVGLAAETGTFGTLPIDVSSSYLAADAYFALSPDGRRIAYDTPTGELAVRDLASGERYAPEFEFEIRDAAVAGYTWVDATHLVGHLADSKEVLESTEADGWVWQPGTAPKRVDLFTYPPTLYLWSTDKDPWFHVLPREGDPRECLSIQNQIPVLCDVVGVIDDRTALTHDGDGAVVALDIRGVEDETLRHVVATPGAPPHGTFATDLIAHALGLAGGAS
jgi:hypothetical protein